MSQQITTQDSVVFITGATCGGRVWHLRTKPFYAGPKRSTRECGARPTRHPGIAQVRLDVTDPASIARLQPNAATRRVAQQRGDRSPHQQHP